MPPLLTAIRRFLGMDLPARVLPLNFALPKISGRLKADESADSDFKRQLEEVKGIPCEYFRLLLAEIKHINRCAMQPRQRLALTRDILQLFYPMALAQIARHAKTGGVPEEEDRRLALNLLADIAQILTVSFQILFDGYYHGRNFKYARARNIVMECASRIFELLILKLQARALRYQLLGDMDWQLANTLFYVMSHYEDVELPLTTLRKVLGQGGNKSDVCLREHYALLHMLARFDMLRWPTHLQWVVESYLWYGVENAVSVRLDDGNSKLGRHELIAYGDRPAGVTAPAHPPCPAMVLDCFHLTESIRRDCMGLIQANQDGTAIPPRFARFPDTEHFIISEQLLRGLENAAADGCVEKEIKVEDLRIFVGFAEVFSLLQHQQGRFASEDRLSDMLAKRSALIAEDHVATEKSVWSLLFQNDKMIRLSTQETIFTTPMQIGSLLAYGVGEDIARPSLAVVSRIFRPSLKVVVIDMQRIASYAEAVVFTVNAGTGQNRLKPALLVYNQKGAGWGLLFPPQDILPGFDKFSMQRRGQEFAFDLEYRRHATADFYLFSTSLSSGQLGVSGSPEYATPSVRKTHAAGWLG
ncbi:MAG: hypothetical protein PHP85_12065 [Gallionella sp.]|nr:hypothetical protein [Gallionella sp.]